VGEGGFDVVLVRKTGPVQTMKFRSWWIYFLLFVMLIMVAGLGAGAYLLYKQQKVVVDMSEDTRLLMLRTERLESLVQEQETRALLAQQAEDERKEALAAAKTKAARNNKEAAAAEAKPKPEKPVLPPEPTSTEHVTIANVDVKTRGSEVSVVFDVTNLHDPSDPAMGYVTVVARAHRAGKPWIEAWPPMRLSPLGRPLNYRRGTPFSVQRYRRLKAAFATGDKKFERMEFLVYSRDGQLLMVHNVNLSKGAQTSSLKGDSAQGGKG
jgi:hypothetical protein